MLALYVPTSFQVIDGHPDVWMENVEELWESLRTYRRSSPLHMMHPAVVEELEFLILRDVEQDFPDVDFAAEPLQAVRSSSGWSGEVRIGERVVGYYQLRKDD